VAFKMQPLRTNLNLNFFKNKEIQALRLLATKNLILLQTLTILQRMWKIRSDLKKKNLNNQWN